jgi:hypothetical protein
MGALATSPATLLEEWLRRQLPQRAADWLDSELEALRTASGERAVYKALALAPQRLGRVRLALAASDVDAARAALPGWQPERWTVDEAARILLLLIAPSPPGGFAARLDTLCATADTGELVGLYKGLPLYPEGDRLTARAAEGLRTNIREIFCAVAHHNPYPALRLGEGAWNQMVLKALFIGVALAPIEGLDRRANADLAQMLCDYARERWAAGRAVAPELWRCVGGHAPPDAVADLARVLRSPDLAERSAAALALADCPLAAAGAALAEAPELAAAIRAGQLSWQTLAPADGPACG